MLGGCFDCTTGPPEGRTNSGFEETRTGLSRSRLHALSLAAVGLAALLIVLLTLSPLGTTNGGCWGGIPCVLGHYVVFLVLGFAVAGLYASSEAAVRSPRRVLIMAMLALWLFAALDEFAQEAVTGRGAQFGDWLADMLGAISGLLGGGFVLRRLLR